MRKILYFLIATLFLYTTHSHNTYALSCVEPSISQWMNDFDGAIVATVLDAKDEVNNGKTVRTVIAKINESYKGVDNETITFIESFTWGSSIVNNDYIYFLMKQDSQWIASPCTTISLVEGNQTSEMLYAELKQYPKILLTKEVPFETTSDSSLQGSLEEANPSPNHISPLVLLLVSIVISITAFLILLRKKT